MNLVVVESPAKAEIIAKFFGPGFEVLASYGHVRDLRPKEGTVEPKAGTVEPKAGVTMHYAVIERNEKHVAALSKPMNKAAAKKTASKKVAAEKAFAAKATVKKKTTKNSAAKTTTIKSPAVLFVPATSTSDA